MKHAIRDKRGNMETEKTLKAFETSSKKCKSPVRNSKYRSKVTISILPN